MISLEKSTLKMLAVFELTKVAQGDMPSVIKQDIFGFEITINNIETMKVF